MSHRASAGLVTCLVIACSPATQDLHTPEAPPATIIQETPASVEALCGSGSRRAWEVLSEDARVGMTRGQCLGKEAKGWHFVSSLVLSDSEVPRYELHTWVSSSGKPRSAHLRTATEVTRYRWADEGLQITLHGETRVLEAPDGAVLDQLWIVPAHGLYMRETMLRLGIGAAGNTNVSTGYVPSRDAVLPLELRFERDETGALVARSEHGDFSLRATDPAQLAALRISEVTAPSRGVVYRELPGDPQWEPTLPEAPRPTYAVPQDLSIEQARIAGGKDEPTLAGEVVRRADLDRSTKHPGVVFLSGSGPQDRYGFVPGTSIDAGSHEIHDALARAGFIVLRYDDRGVGESELGPTSTPGYRAFVDDARRAMKFLAKQPDIARRKIVLVGHSEGAITAAILGRGRPTPRGVVLLASTGRNLREVIYSQIRVTSAGQTSEEIEAAIATAKSIHDAIEQDREVPAAAEPARNWMKEMFREDPVANLQKLKVPVLVLQGSKDFQVDPTLDFRVLADLVEGGKAGGRGSEAHLFTDVDHLFKPEPGQSKLGHYGDLSRRVQPEVIERIVTWSATIVDLR